MLKITQTQSAINRPGKQRRTLEALGLRRTNQTVLHRDTPEVRGMLDKVQHLVAVEEVEE
jgi:large subunit ribosomal protein L30